MQRVMDDLFFSMLCIWYGQSCLLTSCPLLFLLKEHIESQMATYTHAHIEFKSFISHPTITHFFISILSLTIGMLPGACERVETKNASYHWVTDEKLRFNVCICKTKCHVHQILFAFVRKKNPVKVFVPCHLVEVLNFSTS
jgi:hypothetical protein